MTISSTAAVIERIQPLHNKRSFNHHDDESKQAFASLTFKDLGLSQSLLEKVAVAGFQSPTPVQARVIPVLLEGQNVLALAQTGTGKTAAFALPLLEKISIADKSTQLLVLTPTRELAQQVAGVFTQFGPSGLRVCAVYGGQGMREQLQSLRRGVHIAVGTPGRVMDHIRRGTLQLTTLHMVVLDEADEMLRMGFAEDIEWILSHTPEEKLVALFSATMPSAIRHIAHRYLRNHTEVKITPDATVSPKIKEQYWFSNDVSRIDALSRIIEVDKPEAVLVFVRTKEATVEVAEALCQRGLNAAAINGDLPQLARERLISRLKRGALEVLVATDVAARGLDVDRIELVVNFEAPQSIESYIHRIGRTGRASRHGRAILFLSPKEKRLLRELERERPGTLSELSLPSKASMHAARTTRFKQEIAAFLELSRPLEGLEEVIEQVAAECQVTPTTIAAVLCAQGGYLPAFQKPVVSDGTSKQTTSTNGRRDFAERDQLGRNHAKKNRSAPEKDLTEYKDLAGYKDLTGYSGSKSESSSSNEYSKTGYSKKEHSKPKRGSKGSSSKPENFSSKRPSKKTTKPEGDNRRSKSSKEKPFQKRGSAKKEKR